MKKILLSLVAGLALFTFAAKAMADDAPPAGDAKPAKAKKGKKAKKDADKPAADAPAK